MRRHRQIPRLQKIQLFLALERSIAHRRDDLEFRGERAQRNFEAHLIVTFAGATMGNSLGFMFTGCIDH